MAGLSADMPGDFGKVFAAMSDVEQIAFISSAIAVLDSAFKDVPAPGEALAMLEEFSQVIVDIVGVGALEEFLEKLLDVFIEQTLHQLASEALSDLRGDKSSILETIASEVESAGANADH